MDYKTLFYSKKCDGKRGGHTVEELKVICKALNLRTTGKKEVLCQQLDTYFKQQEKEVDGLAVGIADMRVGEGESSKSRKNSLVAGVAEISKSRKNSLSEISKSRKNSLSESSKSRKNSLSKEKSEGIIKETVKVDDISSLLRRKNIEFLVKIFKSNTSLNNEQIKEKVFQIEKGIYDFSSNDEIYRQRSFFVISNLNPKNKNVKNSKLLVDLLSGSIDPYKLGNEITAEQLMPERNIKPDPVPFYQIPKLEDLDKLPDGIIACGKCKSYKTTYNEKQLRAADEPSTKFFFCYNCENRWKMN